ncbi:hypothetical protein [Arsukibacterium sp.]|uniref:hypothetical protein n=1 Tax=Arsukibacterium sp. TaxID=1977258 RepID=UPI00356993DC
MRSGNLFIMALCLLFLLKGTGVYAMVHCQSQQHHQHPIVLDAMAEQKSSANHHHSATDAVDTPSNKIVSNTAGYTYLASAEPCEACDHCCSIHCVPLPLVSETTDIACLEKALQNTYFHTTGIVLPQERPPKTL